MKNLILLSICLFGSVFGAVLTPNKDFSYLTGTVGQTLEVDVDHCTSAPCTITREKLTYTKIKCYSALHHPVQEIITQGTVMGITMNETPSEKNPCKIGAICDYGDTTHLINYNSTLGKDQTMPPLGMSVKATFKVMDVQTQKPICGYTLTTYIK